MIVRPVALFDIDNTLYKGFSLLPLLEQQVEEKIIEEAVENRVLATLQSHREGKVNYETAIAQVLEVYAHGLTGQPYRKVLDSTERFFQSSKDFFAYSLPLINYLQHTHNIALITGEPQHVAEAVADALGVKLYKSSIFAVQDNRFTGIVETYLASRHEKASAISSFITGRNRAGSLAFGDSEGDIEMLRAVEHPVCINASEGLAELATDHGWLIESPETVEAVIKGMAL